MLTIEEMRERVLDDAMACDGTAIPTRRVVRVGLFGSCASGKASDDSDVDLLVEFAAPSAGCWP